MLFRLVYLALLFPLGAWAQADVLSLTQVSSSGGTITLNLSLQSATGEQPAALQWNLNYSAADFTAIQVTAGPAAMAAGKSVTCAGTATAYKCLLLGVNSTAIGNGIVAVISLTVSASPSGGSSLVQLQNPIAASPSGTGILITGSGVTVTLSAVSISNTSLVFSYTVGGTVPQGQGVQVTNTGGAESWSATWAAPWLEVTPASGTSPATITISVTPTGLSPSVYSDTIVISAPHAVTGQTSISVTLTVNTPTLFVPVTPCRIADTRNANGPFGGPPVTGGSFRNFAIPSSVCGVPTTAAAYSLNVAVVPAHTLGYLTVWPAGEPQPEVATLNSLDGRIKSNAAIVPAGGNGAISVFATDTTDVILDIDGYFIANGGGDALEFYALTPCRIADTRTAPGAFGGPDLAAQSVRTFDIQESNCAIPSPAQAYSLNFTALPEGPLGYLTAWPAGEGQPTVASLNAVTGTITANAALVPAGTKGDIDVFATNKTGLLIDIDGYFAPAGNGGLSFYNLAPCRILDTRQNGGSPFSGTMEVIVRGNCGVPSNALGYVLNATAVPTGALNYLTLWPAGTTQPMVSTLNAEDGAITSNLAIVPTTNGAINAFAANQTHLILDIFGYFAP